MSRHRPTLTREHLVLMGALMWHQDDNYHGAPVVDGKRPLGNSGRYQIARDIAEVLGWALDQDEDGDPTEDEIDRALMLLSDLAALIPQIAGLALEALDARGGAR